MRPYGITPDFHAAFKQTWYKLHPIMGDRLEPKSFLRLTMVQKVGVAEQVIGAGADILVRQRKKQDAKDASGIGP